ncbi:MAG: GntR family transcriptional regulator [Bacteroidales bacterium]|nr:GntR family transcriptional regulator [Bacteroidales bacterium]MCF8403953.1 GntR family transcriptional regulator [Bacteroidales bacterium]
MILGKINTLVVTRSKDMGYYLNDSEGNEVLLPNAYLTDEIKIDDEIEVFVYKDSEDRIVATTLKPFLQLEEFAFLRVKDVNRFGAFMDWGLPKDLMVPFAEQAQKMLPGKSYVVYLKKDELSDRLVGTAKFLKYLQHENLDVKEGDEVDLLLYGMADLGMNAVVNNKYRGLIFQSDIHKKIYVGDRIKAYVKQVRDDGKIDLKLEPAGYDSSIGLITRTILEALERNDGSLSLTDKSDSKDIKDQLGLSKKAFKKGVGTLYKQKLIELGPDGIRTK